MAVQNVISIGKNNGGYGVEVSENFKPFYLAENLSFNVLYATPDFIPILSLGQQIGIEMAFPIYSFEFVAKYGLGSAILFSQNINALTFWMEANGEIFIQKIGIYGGIIYQFAGLNQTTGFKLMDEWIPEFGIGYKW